MKRLWKKGMNNVGRFEKKKKKYTCAYIFWEGKNNNLGKSVSKILGEGCRVAHC